MFVQMACMFTLQNSMAFLYYLKPRCSGLGLHNIDTILSIYYLRLKDLTKYFIRSNLLVDCSHFENIIIYKIPSGQCTDVDGRWCGSRKEFEVNGNVCADYVDTVCYL